MPTPRQEKLAEAIIENLKSEKPVSEGELLKRVGYGPGTAEGGTKRIIEREGVQEALEIRGFTVENAKSVVAKLMNDDEQDGNVRLKAADMTFKVHGSYAAEKTVNLSLTADVKDFEKFEEIANKYDEEMKGKLLE